MLNSPSQTLISEEIADLKKRVIFIENYITTNLEVIRSAQILLIEAVGKMRYINQSLDIE